MDLCAGGAILVSGQNPLKASGQDGLSTIVACLFVLLTVSASGSPAGVDGGLTLLYRELAAERSSAFLHTGFTQKRTF